ncbi:phage terminase large subunit [Bowmanella dokdonensis]|uniref:Phage terminase large subunit n=1 Tax=Bowmanella dokdonensis TaxID=751969 RepID=A0A939DMX4_9ALTE|nr:phage terminase large subunit [Bowmanella dokdonensis]MBN7824736.1 phage terminase large subunit [Bowmanella dokdonensis]
MVKSVSQFLSQLSSYADSLRTQIENEVDGFSTDPEAQKERVFRVHDPVDGFRFFCKTYFPHYVDKTESVLHKHLFKRLPEISATKEGVREGIIAPRGEAKSTIATQLHTLWEIVTERTHNTVIIMDAFETQAAPMLEAIKVELDANPRLLQDFPKVAGAGPVWRAGEMITRNNIKVKAFGAGQKIRGIRHGPYRPDRIKLDDIENDENVKSPEQRDKIFKWLKKAVLKLGPPDGSVKVLYIGTLLHYDSVLARTIKLPSFRHTKFRSIVEWPVNMDLWEEWEEILRNDGADDAQQFYQQRKAAMDEGAIVSWPEKRPLYFLMMERADDHHSFDCEYQNDPTNEDEATFRDIKFWVHVGDRWVYYGACDPSLGKKNKGRDPSAIGVGGFDRQKGVLHVVEASIRRRIPNLIIEDIIKFHREYNCLVWAIEAVQFQEFLRTRLMEVGLERGIAIPTRAVIPNTDKDLRIESLEPYVTNGQILLHSRQTILYDQLKHWPEHAHDDGPDMLQMLWMVAVSGAGGIPKIQSQPARQSFNTRGFGYGR